MALRIRAAHNVNSAEAGKKFIETKNALVSIYLAAGSFDSDFFEKRAKEVFISDDKILLINIYSNQNGISYLIAKNSSYLKNPAADELAVGAAAAVIAAGALKYNTIPLSESVYTDVFYSGDDEKFNIDGHFAPYIPSIH